MSKPSPFEEAIDRLYQLPLDQFVAARNAAVREAKGDEAATLRALQKPNVVAWGLNQLVWSARPVFERLVGAAAALRTAQANALMRRPSDLRAADAEHRAALREAIASTGQILERAGHAPTPDTVRALTAAFEALPWPDPPGRLAKPPAAPGFDVFAGIQMPPPGTAPPARKTGRRDGAAAAHGSPSEAPTGSAPALRPARSTARQDAQRDREAKQAREGERKAARSRLDEARREAAAAAQRVRANEARLATLRDAERRAQEQLDRARAAVSEAEDSRRESAAAESRARTGLREAEETVARLQR